MDSTEREEMTEQLDSLEGEFPAEEVVETSFLEPRGVFDHAIIGTEYDSEFLIYSAEKTLALAQEMFEMSDKEARLYLDTLVRGSEEKPIVFMWELVKSDEYLA